MEIRDAIVVDDDCLQLALLVDHCHAMGFGTVRNFHTAGDALRELRSGPGHTPDTLLVLDLNMPRMDGMEILNELQRIQFPGRLLFISGEGPRMLEAATRVARGMGLAVAGAIAKPVTREAMRVTLEAVPDEAAPESPEHRFSAEDIHGAMRGNQLEVFYQPKVVVATCRVSGYEALLRWRHPILGLLAPSAFLGSLETENLLPAVTRFLLQRVLRDVPGLSIGGVRVPVAVNVAISDLERRAFCDEVMAALKLHKVSPQDLHLEVTERGVGSNAIAALHSMSRLRLQRVRLAVDDFGTGEASLLRLRDYPFDYMKIDRRFVHGAATDGDSRAIYDACSAMAYQMGLGVVAEGVENEEDWHFIRRRNCEQAQGYFIGHPMPLANVAGWLREWNARICGLKGLAA